MIKTILIDKAQNVCELLSSYFQKADDIDFLGCFDDFEKIKERIDINKINLIIFDISNQNSNEIFETIEKIQQQNKNIKLIALSYDMDTSLVVRTLNHKVSDFLFKPVIPNILEASIRKIDFAFDKKEENTIKKAKTISVFSLKGGVGKTSIALNLAYELERKTKQNVCLLDFNMNSSDCAFFLGLKTHNNTDDLLLKFQQSSKDVALSLIPRFKDSSLFVLSFENAAEPGFKLSALKITTIINSLKSIFDYIIIDTYCAYDENNLASLNACDLILYISLLSSSSIQNTQRMIELFSKIGYNQSKIKLILNRYSDNSQISTDEFEKSVNKEVYFKIPNNYLTMADAINRLSPLDLTNPQSNIAKAFKNLANIIDESDIQKESLTSEYNHGIYNIIHKMGE